MAHALRRSHSTAYVLFILVACVLTGGMGFSTRVSSVDQPPGEWSITGNMVSAQTEEHTLTLLSTGQVLLVGGSDINSQLYNPGTGLWSAAASMDIGRAQHTATRLLDGRVLVTGGHTASGCCFRVLATTELYNPDSKSWIRTGDLNVARRGHTATLLPSGKVLVAGGCDIHCDSPTSSAEIYDPATGVWTRTGSLSVARDSATAVLLPDGRVLVAGGGTYGGAPAFASAELFDPAPGTWSPTAAMRSARAAHTLVLLPGGKALAAGGWAESGVLPVTTELFDPATGTWSSAGSLSIGRFGHTAALLPNGKVLVSGGTGNNEALASAELFDPSSSSWSRTGDMVVPHAVHSMALLSTGSVLVAGGYPSSTTAELYAPAPAPSGTPGTWTQKFPTASPGARHGGVMAYDDARGKVVMFGGCDQCPGQQTATWTWDGTAWAQRTVSGPPARVSPSMAYDASRQRIVLFGGTICGGGCTSFGDTWIWDGTTWRQEHPAISPPARSEAAMAYDAAHNRVVLFGGLERSNSGSRLLGDTWAWDGTSWTELHPASSPPGRYGASMVYDVARQQAVLFGGFGAGARNDTWAWDGTSWRQLFPTTYPSARFYQAMAYDPARQATLLFGGDDSQGLPLGDTWTWNGSTWAPLNPAIKPSPRGRAAISPDGGRGNLVLFGGDDNSSFFGDTWVWGSTSATPGIKLAFTQQPPTTLSVGQTFTTQVAVQTASGTTVITDNSTVVTLDKGSTSTGPGNLVCASGRTKTVVAGVATFACSMTHGGSYTLTAAASGPTTATSSPLIVIDKLVVFAPGIDLKQDAQKHFNPYTRAYNSFATIMAGLNCPQPTTTDETLPLSPVGAIAVQPPFPNQVAGPLVLCGSSGVAWLPYSYSGTDTTAKAVLSYFGDTTGQDLSKSASAMDAIVAVARGTLSSPSPLPLTIIGHSLGGAVASFWGGATANRSVPIITLDSPVNGAWLNTTVLVQYCTAPSIGLLNTIQSLLRILSCPLLPVVPALDPAKAEVLTDLNTVANIKQMSQAHAFNFAYAFDAIVPSWYAIVPANATAKRAALYDSWSTTGCGIGDLFHFCIRELAASAVVNMIRANTPLPYSLITQDVQLTVCLATTIPGVVEATWPDRSSRTLFHSDRTPVQGCGVVRVPWIDAMLTVRVSRWVTRIAVLPGENRELHIICGYDESLPGLSCAGNR